MEPGARTGQASGTTATETQAESRVDSGIARQISRFGTANPLFQGGNISAPAGGFRRLSAVFLLGQEAMQTGSSDSLLPSGVRLRSVAGYVAMLVVAGLVLWGVTVLGRDLTAPLPAAGAAPHAAKAGHASALGSVLLAIATIVVAARLVGHAFERYLKQPPVMGEIAAGILLGPSALGAISPEAYAWLLPADAAPHLRIVANIGVVLFMFLVGLELDTRLLRGTAHATLAISHASIVAPFMLGSALALALYPKYSSSDVDFLVFALFIGVSMSVTAFPVLARILGDRRLTATPLGATALACAAADDATAWCLLAVVSGVASAQLGSAGITIALVVGYVLVMLLVVRPLATYLTKRADAAEGPVSPTMLALIFGLLMVSAVATERIGIHALFGAFLFGALIPHDSRLAEQLRVRIEDLVAVLLLPIFFAFTGMRTRIGLVSSGADWLMCGAIIAVATLGKFGGTAIAARAAGLTARDASSLGVLMNTRGLMELIVLNVGLDMGVLSPTLFAMLVLMALVTTFSTTPLLSLIQKLPVSAHGSVPAGPGAEHKPL
jgi:Kef-type K+ transport system membrane component KefB